MSEVTMPLHTHTVAVCSVCFDAGAGWARDAAEARCEQYRALVRALVPRHARLHHGYTRDHDAYLSSQQGGSTPLPPDLAALLAATVDDTRPQEQEQ